MRVLPMILAATALALAPTSIVWANPGHAGHDHVVEAAFGRPSDSAKGGRVVQVVMKENNSGMAFAPERIEVARASRSSLSCAMAASSTKRLVIGTVKANNAKRLSPKTSGVLR